MGTIGIPQPVKLFTGVLTSRAEVIPAVEERLCGLFGPVDLRSSGFPFDATHYYDEEMGSPLVRYFYSFSRLADPSSISWAKIVTNRIEADLAEAGIGVARPVNLDPGYLEESKIVLASTKNFYHRILISDGIYAEVTMHYEHGLWCCLPWTFPDFRTGRYDGFFTELRTLYRNQLKTSR